MDEVSVTKEVPPDTLQRTVETLRSCTNWLNERTTRISIPKTRRNDRASDDASDCISLNHILTQPLLDIILKRNQNICHQEGTMAKKRVIIQRISDDSIRS
mmetsp:Transcript_6435/g.15622  ORF Transcript_6435/g.15622 Transcript_6435/m.15622 type:complete len:101 (-) Transcript_6435:146-448(-)